MIRILLLAALTGCAAQPAPAPVSTAIVVPPGLDSCPQGVPEPRAPKPPRTLDAIVAWTFRLDAALRQTEHARAVCADRLGRLNDVLDGVSP